MARVIAYAYKPVRTPLHSLDAGLKLLSLCALSFISFFGGPSGLVFSIVFVIAGAIAARLGPSELLAGSRPLLLTTGIVLLARAFSWTPLALDTTGLYEGLLFAVGILVSFSAGSVLFATTTTGEIRESLSGLEKLVQLPLAGILGAIGTKWSIRMARSLSHINSSLVIALVLGFIPRVFEIWEAAEDARKARCGSTGIAGLAALVPLVAERLIDLAEETAKALESRGYDGSI